MTGIAVLCCFALIASAVNGQCAQSCFLVLLQHQKIGHRLKIPKSLVAPPPELDNLQHKAEADIKLWR